MINLTSKQFMKLIEFIDGPLPDEYKSMTTDAILAELEA